MHGDHAGGNAELKDLSGAAIHMHRADTDRIDAQAYLAAMRPDQLLLSEPDNPREAEVRVLEQLGNAWGVDRVLEDGDEIDLGDDVRLRVIPSGSLSTIAAHWREQLAV